jgi:glucarate dehydratase
LKIESIETIVVRVPLRVPFSSSVGTRPSTTRTVVRVRTEGGLVGLGETFRGRETASLIQELAPTLIGTDVTRIESMLRTLRMTPFFYGYVGFAAIAGIEVACWDIIGKASSQPLHVLFGGATRNRIPASGIVFHRPEHDGLPLDALASSIADDARELVDTYGTAVIKLKGSSDPDRDLTVLEALERELNGAVKLRIDPNAAWSVADTLRMLPRLESVSLEYLEDPVQGIDAMARVRGATHLPLATNMCVVKPDDIGPAFRLGAVDVILADAYKWGGLSTSRKLAGACEMLGLSMGMHSGSELGISTAAHLHLAASTPVIDHAMDSTLWLQSDDIIENPFTIDAGAIRLPSGPGLGVDLDEEKLESYAVHRATCSEGI